MMFANASLLLGPILFLSILIFLDCILMVELYFSKQSIEFLQLKEFFWIYDFEKWC